MTYPYPLSTALAALQAALPQSYQPKTWLENMHEDYRQRLNQWVFARDHYTGDLLLPNRIGHYLIQKYLGETPEAFTERVALSDYTPHFSTIVDSLVGMLFQAEPDATKVWGSLGDPENLDTPIGKLGIDADGEGHGYETLWRLLAMELTGIHKAWILVDGNVPGAPRVRVLRAEDVPNWRYDKGVLVEALVCEPTDERTSIQDKEDAAKQYVHFTVNGWQRYRQTGGPGGPGTSNPSADPKEISSTYRVEKVGNGGTYAYFDQNGAKALPIFPVELPLQRPVGYILARKANAIYNQESVRDAGLRSANFSYLNVVGNDAVYKKVTDMLKLGARALPNLPGQNQHAFIAPSGEPARVLTEVLKEKVKEFWRSGFREYGDAASRKTAEEVRQDVAQGVGAFLALLKAAVDDAENQTLWRLEQTHFPKDRSKWFDAKVRRSDDFIPFDINWTIERLRERYFGAASVVPVGRTARIEAARQIAVWDGLPVNLAEIAASVDALMLLSTLDLTQDLPLPAEARAENAVRYMVACGYLDPKAPLVGADGKPVLQEDGKTPALLITDLRAKALVLAKATEKQMETVQAGANEPGAKPLPQPPAKPGSSQSGPPLPSGRGTR